MKVRGDRIFLSKGTGCAGIVFGVGFLAPGLFFLWLKAYLAGGILTALAVILLGLRWTTTLDGSRRLIIRKWGLIAGFIPRLQSSVAGASGVRAGVRRLKGPRGASSREYQVWIELGARAELFWTVDTPEQAKEIGEAAAKILGTHFYFTPS